MGLHLLRLRSWCTFIAIERQWQQWLVTISCGWDYEWRSAPLAYARALILRMHTSTESFIIQPHIVACRIACWRRARMRPSAARTCAQAQCTRRRTQARDTARARRQNAILKHASPVLGSGLGKIGQAGDLGLVTPGHDRGRSGAWGAGRCSAAPSAPANPGF